MEKEKNYSTLSRTDPRYALWESLRASEKKVLADNGWATARGKGRDAVYHFLPEPMRLSLIDYLASQSDGWVSSVEELPGMQLDMQTMLMEMIPSTFRQSAYLALEEMLNKGFRTSTTEEVQAYAIREHEGFFIRHKRWHRDERAMISYFALTGDAEVINVCYLIPYGRHRTRAAAKAVTTGGALVERIIPGFNTQYAVPMLREMRAEIDRALGQADRVTVQNEQPTAERNAPSEEETGSSD